MAQSTFKSGLDKIVSDAAKKGMRRGLEERLDSMARDAVGLGTINVPVWSGAYVRSFSFKANNTSSRGRRVPSDDYAGGIPTGGSEDRDAGLRNLESDISSILADENTVIKTITLRNDSPHASAVEEGSLTVPLKGNEQGLVFDNAYKVFAQIRRKYG